MFYKLAVPVLVLSLSFSHQAVADHEHHAYKKCVQTAMKSVSLSAEQQAKMDAFKKQMRDLVKEKHTQMKAICMQMKPLIRAPQLDNSKVDALINQKKEMFGEIMKARITYMNQAYNVMNDQQKTTFSSMMDACEKSM